MVYNVHPVSPFTYCMLVCCSLPSRTMKLQNVLAVLALAAEAVALSIGGKQMHVERDSDGLQNIVSSLMCNM